MDISDAEARHRAGVQAKIDKRNRLRDEYFARCAAAKAAQKHPPPLAPSHPESSGFAGAASSDVPDNHEPLTTASAAVASSTPAPSASEPLAQNPTPQNNPKKRDLEHELAATVQTTRTSEAHSLRTRSSNDCRLADLAPIRKKRKSSDVSWSKTANLNMTMVVAEKASPARIRAEVARLPDWYTNAKKPHRHSAEERRTWDRLKELQEHISQVEAMRKNPVGLQLATEQVYLEIDRLRFMDVSPWGLKRAKLLDDDHGLPQIFKGLHRKLYPRYVRDDAHSLYKKWIKEIFDGSNMFRGINNMINNKKSKGRAPSIDKQYKIDWRFFGDGHLVNGDWFANQLCAVRDGAHGSAMGGISGIEGKGATSISLSRDLYKTDTDELNEIHYSGTLQTKPGESSVTANTQYLIDSEASGLPVRVLRSMHLLPSNPYRPTRGFRYDGLYTVVDYECLSLETQHYLFKLVRNSGQGEIRYRGVGKRPTEKEMETFDREMKMYGKKPS